MNILDDSYANAGDRLSFLIEEATRITGILRDRVLCAECGENVGILITPNQRAALSKEFRELCKEIRVEVEVMATTTDPEAATRTALANESLPPHVRAAILAAAGLPDEPEREQ